MGKGFSMLKSALGDAGLDQTDGKYLEFLLNSTENNVFDLGFVVPQMHEILNLDMIGISKFRDDFLSESKNQSLSVITPFPTTSIEDPQGVLFVDKVDQYGFNMVSWVYAQEINLLYSAKIRTNQHIGGRRIFLGIIPVFVRYHVDNKFSGNILNDYKDEVYKDLFNSGSSAIMQLAYIHNEHKIPQSAVKEAENKSEAERNKLIEFYKNISSDPIRFFNS